MSRPDRQTTRRTLSFEDLEAKTSLTNLLGVSAPMDTTALFGEATYDPTLSKARVDLFLNYVGGMDSVDIARGLPSSDDVAMADEWLATNRPDA